MPADGSTGQLYGKIATVVQQVEEVAKRGHNDHFNYDYATAEDILKVLRVPLADQNVALMCSLGSIDERAYTTSGGKESVITTAHVEFCFVDGDTGEQHRCTWAGQGDDPADKGLGKAYTNAIKTFLRSAFMLPQGDDPEADSRTDERAGDRASSGPRRSGGGSGKPSDAQLDFLRKIITGKARGVDKPSLTQLNVVLMRMGIAGASDGWMERLNKAQCSELLDKLTKEPLPSEEHPTDLPDTGEGEFEHPPEKPLEMLG